MNDLVKRTLEYGFLTGSRAWGTWNEYSDWDIAVYGCDEDVVFGLFEGLQFEQSRYFRKYHVYFKEGELNIVFLSKAEYVHWYLATKAMAAMFSEMPSNIKKELTRNITHGMFETIRGSLKASQIDKDALFTVIQAEAKTKSEVAK